MTAAPATATWKVEGVGWSCTPRTIKNAARASVRVARESQGSVGQARSRTAQHAEALEVHDRVVGGRRSRALRPVSGTRHDGLPSSRRANRRPPPRCARSSSGTSAKRVRLTRTVSRASDRIAEAVRDDAHEPRAGMTFLRAPPRRASPQASLVPTRHEVRERRVRPRAGAEREHVDYPPRARGGDPAAQHRVDVEGPERVRVTCQVDRGRAAEPSSSRPHQRAPTGRGRTRTRRDRWPVACRRGAAE